MKDTFQKWVAAIGALEAKARLTRRGISSRVIERLIADTYCHEPRGATLAAISEEMAKDGIVLTDEAS